MSRRVFFPLAILAFILFSLSIALLPPSLAQEWKFRLKPRGTLKVVDLWVLSQSVMLNYAESLVSLDTDNNLAPCLAEDLRWVDDRTIEFKLRKGVTFHNGEEFNAEAVKVNWEVYRKMESPRISGLEVIPDETAFEIIDKYTVRFTFPEPDGLAFPKFWTFRQFAPLFFAEHKFDEKNWGILPKAGPWGTGPFKLVEGGLRFARPSDRVVLEAFEGYWDRQYPKVQKVIFDNTLIGNRKEAMRLCRETEGKVDIVTHIRPLDTLKVAESPFAKVVKSKDVIHLRCWFNQRKRGSKWRDIRLRQALNYAVNRKELWKYGAKGNAYNLEAFYIPAGAYGHNPNVTPYAYDTDKARSLLAEAGYPNGFDVKIITPEAWKLEAQIIKRMLWRIGLKVTLDILTFPEWVSKIYIPILEKPPEEQDWDLCLSIVRDYFGHTGTSFLTYVFLESSDFRWIEYDPVYEGMWKDMERIVDFDAQEDKIRQLVQYIHDHAYVLFIYSPLSLYAVNKEVNFVPQKNGYLRLKATSVADNHWSIRGKKR
jgi:peptide/nickel transport system substrate-binding protein